MNNQLLPDGYTYKYFKEDDINESIFRIKEITDEKQAFVWLEKFSFLNKTTWKKARTYPKTAKNGRQNAFKVDMKCGFAANKRVKGIRSTKQTGCRATLQILIKRTDATLPEGKQNELDRDWPTLITVRGTHTSEELDPDYLKYRDLSESSLSKLKDLFRKGHTAASALETLKTEFLFEYGDKYFEVAADGYYVPSYSKVHKLFEKEFVAEYGQFNDENFEILKEQLDVYTSTSEGSAAFYKTSDNLHYFVVICSPIMQRVHALVPQSSELVLVDASGGMDKQRHRIYVFVSPTAAGALPLGVIITDTEKQYVFSEALAKLKDSFPAHSFYGRKEPQVFITDNDLKERGPLKEHFPNAILLLCQFHFLKALWSWLCDSNHKIDASHRQELYDNVKDVLYAKTIETAEAYHQKLLSSSVLENYNNFRIHYLNLCSYKNEWATCFRQNLPLRGSNTTNYVEVVFRILKDCIFERLMAFNLAQFVDYILTRYEIYLEKRLIDFSNGRCSKAILKHFLPAFNAKIYSFDKSENGNFIVKNESNHAEYTVDILHGTCTCMVGLSGKICKHSSFVIANIGADIKTSFNLATKKTRETMLYIATGKKAPANWHQPSKLNLLSILNNENIESELVDENEPNNIIDHQASSSSVSQNTIPAVSQEEKEKFNNVIKRIMTGLETAPEIYAPAFKKMVQNFDKFGSTEVGLITTMHTIGMYNGALAKNHAKKLIKRSHAMRIGVQPTAPGRRKTCLTGKKKLCAGRERGRAKVASEIKCHDYTTFGSLPKRKRKAQHSLADCVYANKGLPTK